MSNFLGYGEDAFTLWALKNRKSEILKEFQDKTIPSDCLAFYRPSFGRGNRRHGAEFGEFDGILISTENIYLIESKWDNLATSQNDRLILRKEQIFRHQIFSWYLTNWHNKYSRKWERFEKEHADSFQKNFERKNIAPTGSLMAGNLEFILSSILKHFEKVPPEHRIKNVLLFFYNKKYSSPPTKIPNGFNLVSIDYGKEITGNFVSLD